MFDLREFSTVLFDIDGVLCEGERLLPGAIDMIAFLNESNISYGCVTNSAVLTPDQRAARLGRLGLEIDPSRIITSALAVRQYLDANFAPGTRIFIFGPAALREALMDDDRYLEDETHPQVVVVGHNERFSYDTCRLAVQAIRAGAVFVATNPDVLVPGDNGPVPETGALLAYLEAASGVAPRVIGKPRPDMFHLALTHLAANGAALMIGDRLDTDISGAHAAGLAAVLVMTGVTDDAALRASAYQPDAVFADLPAMLTAWQR